jgi:hypothetical protein
MLCNEGRKRLEKWDYAKLLMESQLNEGIYNIAVELDNKGKLIVSNGAEQSALWKKIKKWVGKIGSFHG